MSDTLQRDDASPGEVTAVMQRMRTFDSVGTTGFVARAINLPGFHRAGGLHEGPLRPATTYVPRHAEVSS